MLSAAFSLTQGDFRLDIDFTSNSGVTALFGASGSGKTTVIRAIAGLARPDRGIIRIGDRTLFDAGQSISLPGHRRNLGMVFQDSRLFPHLSVRSNITYANWAGGRRRGHLEDFVELLGLANLLDRRPGSLSGGERQRVAIARALYSSPDLLLMDEPLASLDAPRKAEILPYLDRLKRETNLPILFVSHALDEVTRLADNLVVLDRGHQIAAGPVADLLQRPELGTIFGTMEAGALVDARVTAHQPQWGLTALKLGIGDDAPDFAVSSVDLAPGEWLRLRILARDVALAVEKPGASSIRNMLPGIIETITRTSATHTLVNVRLDGTPGVQLNARITSLSVSELGLIVGQPVWCLVKGVATEARMLAPIPFPSSN